MTLQPPPAAPRAGTCGRCGYSAAALTRPLCPECGSDLARVGIRPIDAGPTDPLVRRQRRWTVLMLIITAALWVVARNYMSESRSVRSWQLASAYGRYHIAIETETIPIIGPFKRREVRTGVCAWATSGFVSVQPLYIAPPLRHPTSVEAVLNHLAGQGVDTTAPQVQREARELVLMVDIAAEGGHAALQERGPVFFDDFYMASTRSTGTPTHANKAAILILGAAVWYVGRLRIARGAERGA